MTSLQYPLWHARQTVQVVWQLHKYAVAFFLAMLQPKAVLAARLLAAESQLAVCKHRIQQKKDPRPRFTPVLWVVLSKCLVCWQGCTHLIQRKSRLQTAPSLKPYDDGRR